ncbi:hypothetical protein GCM10028895_52460 [Pontibacter rugosus]
MDHAEMNHSATPGKVVVETPNYASAGDPVKQQLAQLLGSYLRLKDALVASDTEQVQVEAQAVLAAAEKVEITGLAEEQQQFATEKLDEVKQSASKMAAATDVTAQRENLDLLSEATFSLTKAFGASDQKLFYQHCPMANNDQGGYWLSSSAEIRNPYFGEQMLKCGSTEESIN